MYILLSKVKTDTKLKDKANQCHWENTLGGGLGGCQAEVAKAGMKRNVLFPEPGGQAQVGLCCKGSEQALGL